MDSSDLPVAVPLTCVVVEDQRMFLQLLVAILQAHRGLEICAKVTTAAEGIAACREYRPDLLILDLSLPDQDGIAVAEALVDINPEARLIVLSAQATSFVCPPSVRPILHAVIDKIEAYEALGDEIQELLPSPGKALENLTDRECQILRYIGEGMSNSEIAATLRLSVHTVEVHRRNMSGKLGCKGAALVRYATLAHLVPPI